MVPFPPHKHTCLLLAPTWLQDMPPISLPFWVLMGKPVVLGLHLGSVAFFSFVITLSLSGRREMQARSQVTPGALLMDTV